MCFVVAYKFFDRKFDLLTLIQHIHDIQPLPVDALDWFTISQIQLNYFYFTTKTRNIFSFFFLGFHFRLWHFHCRGFFLLFLRSCTNIPFALTAGRNSLTLRIWLAEMVSVRCTCCRLFLTNERIVCAEHLKTSFALNSIFDEFYWVKTHLFRILSSFNEKLLEKNLKKLQKVHWTNEDKSSDWKLERLLVHFNKHCGLWTRRCHDRFFSQTFYRFFRSLLSNLTILIVKSNDSFIRRCLVWILLGFDFDAVL